MAGRNRTGLVLAVLACFGVSIVAGQRKYEADIIVYGGTSAGVTAAVQASLMEKSVILVGPDRHLGGLTSGGLGWTDSGNTEVIGGLAREFYHRIWLEYQDPDHWKWQPRSEYGNQGQGTKAMDDDDETMWTFEPRIAEQVFDTWALESQIPVHRNEWLDRSHGVRTENGRIVSISMLSGKTYKGKIFIDATYEGDLMAAAGVSYHVGRESSSQYGEEWNGIQVGVLHHRHNFGQPGLVIDPYVVQGDPESGILPRVSEGPPGRKGDGDQRIQAYCFRMCLTDHSENRRPFPRPDGYDPQQYEVLARILKAGWNEVFQKFDPIPNRKTDTNNHGPFSTDNIGMNYMYPEGTYREREQIIREHEHYQKGLMYFLSNDSRVPEEIREEMAQWGLAKDEFIDNGNWPHQIYVREARRMIGTYIMTENEVLGKRDVPQAIGMGSYTMDSHNVQRYIKPDGTLENEGDIGVRPPRPYSIAFGSILPKKEEIQNLLVPVALSSSHIAFGSIRMEPVFMILGQSAATAGSHAIDQDCAVQDVDYKRLRQRLTADKQRLEVQTEQASPIERVGWLTGCWVQKTPRFLRHEQWMHPLGKTMLGMSRTVVGDKTVEYEYLRIEEQDGTLVLVANPSGQAETAFRQVELSDDLVLFENPEHDFPQRIRYRLLPDDSALARIEGEKNGKTRIIDFPMIRSLCDQIQPTVARP